MRGSLVLAKQFYTNLINFWFLYECKFFLLRFNSWLNRRDRRGQGLLQRGKQNGDLCKPYSHRPLSFKRSTRYYTRPKTENCLTSSTRAVHTRCPSSRHAYTHEGVRDLVTGVKTITPRLASQNARGEIPQTMERNGVNRARGGAVIWRAKDGTGVFRIRNDRRIEHA